MSKRILVLSTSPRIGGNSETLADVFIKGAEEAGHETKKICLYDKKIEFCKGCLGCQTTGKCILRDDAERIIAQMKAMDVLVFATPIYFYEMSGQMKHCWTAPIRCSRQSMNSVTFICWPLRRTRRKALWRLQ